MKELDPSHAIFEAIKPVAQGISETFGSLCEVIIHDYSQPDHSVIYVAGDVTSRRIGQSASTIGLRLIAQGDAATDEYNYVTRSENGRILKSTTILLRSAGHVVGAFCVNFDVTDLRHVSKTISELVGPDGTSAKPADVEFSVDVRELINQVLDEHESRSAVPIERLSREERYDIVRALQSRGVFALRRSVSDVATRLGVTRATVYNYLQELRAEETSAAEGTANPDRRPS